MEREQWASLSRCNITQSAQWHFEMLPTPFFHTDHNKSLEAQANIKVAGGFYFMGDKKKTGFYLMPSLNRQALCLSTSSVYAGNQLPSAGVQSTAGLPVGIITEALQPFISLVNSPQERAYTMTRHVSHWAHHWVYSSTWHFNERGNWIKARIFVKDIWCCICHPQFSSGMEINPNMSGQ